MSTDNLSMTINLFLSLVILGIIWQKQQDTTTSVGADQFLAVFSLILEILGIPDG